ncbi:zinc finger BED domain-containing protein RICESLEEPER 1-like [Humulus lupulus]|uniref:zinc finger BED domain-containing protein RICESLEEPER 1-like n=1 Tax=Humulus lupulus TaxID=3486 RepID=UPI002B417B0E|nr:zinc finger BED domain-containing protein RICESLEEPER 1-like [Humulus lupulus]
MITDFTKKTPDSKVNLSGNYTTKFSHSTFPLRFTIARDIYQLFLEEKKILRKAFVNPLKKYKGVFVKKAKCLVLGGEMFHVCCCAHISNLVVTDGLKKMYYAISSIRNAIRCGDKVELYIHDARSCIKVLEERVNGEKVDDPPDTTDWTNVEVFVKFLKAFYELTLKLSGSLYVTLNLFFEEILQVQVELNQMKNSTNELMSKMAESMQLKFDKYWGNFENINLLQYIASILDPRFKMDVVRNGFRYLYDPIEAENMIQKVENMMNSLYTFYKKFVVLSNSSNDQQASENVTTNASESSTITSFLIKLKFLSSEVISNDLDDYLADRKEKLVGNKDFDILDWWKRNDSKYLVVSLIAKDVLAVQMSTFVFESSFSIGGRILDPFRSSLSPKIFEVLICSKNWLTYEYVAPIVLRQYTDGIEELETSEQIKLDESCITNTGTKTTAAAATNTTF